MLLIVIIVDLLKGYRIHFYLIDFMFKLVLVELHCVIKIAVLSKLVYNVFIGLIF